MNGTRSTTHQVARIEMKYKSILQEKRINDSIISLYSKCIKMNDNELIPDYPPHSP